MFSAETPVSLTAAEKRKWNTDNPGKDYDKDRPMEKKIQGWEITVPMVKMISAFFSLLFAILIVPIARKAFIAAGKEAFAAAKKGAIAAKAAAGKAGAAASKIQGAVRAKSAGFKPSSMRK